ncbi:MAG: putative sugar transporter, periplasmic component [Chloroflexi bacterium]|nr:putative sugar transporter, periplasmic component [Chloroflexota bacterium]
MDPEKSHEQTTLFGRPIERRELLKLTGTALAGGAIAGMWLSPELAAHVQAAARGEKLTGSLTIMKQYSPVKAKWVNFMAAFTKETGIKVNLDDVIYNNQYQKITVQGQASVPGDDLVEIDTIWTGSFAGAGFTLDLSNFLPASVQKQIAPPSLGSIAYKGKMFGVPEYNSSKHFFYNIKMLSAVGLKRPPATLDEMFQYCEILKKNKGKLGIQYPMSWSWKQAESLTCDYVQMVDSLGGRFYNTDNVTPVFNKGAGVQALTMMKMMLDKGYVAPGSLSHTETDVQNDLLSGKTAMCTNWEGIMNYSHDKTQTVKSVLGQIRMSLIPGSKGRLSGSCLGPEGWAIMKASPNVAQAKAFINWWISAKSQIQGMAQFDQFPIYSSLYGDPSLAKVVKAGDVVDDFAVYGKQFDYAQARPNFPGYLDASTRLQVHLHKAFLGSESLQAALNNAVADMQHSTGGGNNP